MKKELIYKFTDSGLMYKSRPYARGVYHDSTTKQAIATDGYLMMVSSKDYEENLSDQIIDEVGNRIDSEYCNWRNILLSKMWSETTDMVSISKEYKDSLNTFLDMCRDANVAGRKRGAQIGFIFGETSMVFLYENFKIFLQGAKHIGATKIRYSAYWKSSAIEAENDMGDRVLLLPITANILNTDDVNLTFLKYN